MGSLDRGHSKTLGNRMTRSMLLALGAIALVPSAAPASAAPARSVVASDLRGEIGGRAPSELREFYAARGNRPLWVGAGVGGAATPAARALLAKLDTAEWDGVKRGRLKIGGLDKALDRARSGSPRDIAAAELALSRSFVAYVRAIREVRRGAMIYESPALMPGSPTPGATLRAAASARSLQAYVEMMGWMHPLYAPMRDSLADMRLAPGQRRQILANLQRLRALPANPAARYVLIDAAGARLWMYENGRPVDSMKVVVGKPDQQTPIMAGFLRYAVVNPYWNVPVDLVQQRIAANVLDKGLGYLSAGGYQVLSDWTDSARVIDPQQVDWRAVAEGSEEARVRQLPGGSNFMGTVKFMFPNAQGIYLHDTPDKQLMLKDARQFSSGCVRLEDAPRLGRWLLRKPLPRGTRAPEQRIDLPVPVPVYITYLTALPEKGGRIAFRDDVYDRDGIGGNDRAVARFSDAARP